MFYSVSNCNDDNERSYEQGDKAMNLGGLVFHGFKAVFGNIEVMVMILSFAIVYSLAFTCLGIYQRSKE